MKRGKPFLVEARRGEAGVQRAPRFEVKSDGGERRGTKAWLCPAPCRRKKERGDIDSLSGSISFARERPGEGEASYSFM